MPNSIIDVHILCGYDKVSCNYLAGGRIIIQKPEGFWVNEFEDRWQEGYEGLTTSFSLMALNICWKWVNK